MKVGVPKEIKSDEYRVAMLPVGALELTQAGHTVLIEQGAGQGSGIADVAYHDAGATIASSADEIWAEADLIVKVKEPQPPEWPCLRPDQVVFTYFHFAADEALTRAVVESGITAIAYETLRDARGNLPLLTPMSEVAGRMSIQEGPSTSNGPRKAAASCSPACRESPPPKSPSWAVASSAPTQPRSPPDSALPSVSSISTSIAFATWTISCPRTSRPSIPTAIPSWTRSNEPTWSSAPS